MTKRGAGAHPALLFCLEVRIAGGGIWAADKTVQCHQHLIFIPEGCLTIAQRFNVGCAGSGRASPGGTAEPTGPVSRPFGTYRSSGLVPNVQTLGYFRMSLRDRVLAQLRECFLVRIRRNRRFVDFVRDTLPLSCQAQLRAQR